MISGRAVVFGDDINTDMLHPSYFFSLDTTTVRKGFMGELASVDDREEDLPRVIVAGKNFGCGSSRETTMTALKMAGVRAVVAESFGRIFFRNSMCLGVAARTAPSVTGIADPGDVLKVEGDRLINERTGRSIALHALDPYWSAVLEAGGLIPYLTETGAI